MIVTESCQSIIKKKLSDELRIIKNHKNMVKSYLATIKGGYKIEDIKYRLPALLSKKCTKQRPKIQIKKHNKEKNYAPSDDMWKTILHILQSIKRKRKQARWFLEPVKTKVVPDYYAFIRQPMDLRTVEGKIKNRSYNNPIEYRDDMRLIWKNCRKYNPTGVQVRKAGDSLSEYFEKKWSCSGIENQLALGLAIENSGRFGPMPLEESITQLKHSEIILEPLRKNSHDFKKRPTYESKRMLAIAIGTLSGENLTKLLDILAQEFEESQQDPMKTSMEYELDIDMLSPRTFFKLERFVEYVSDSIKKKMNNH
jgi:hypothetical protein